MENTPGIPPILPPANFSPVTPRAASNVAPGTPSPKAQSWGAFLSIVIIVLMVTLGAFYAWGSRIAEEQALGQSSTQPSP